ncbi:HpcH/HpaI aldolase/citrate lyase family protein [Streptomyces brevispora]|uniref:Citrate lyase subunit beta/citryl-CoA lyase n=1 Tax=Streptomyces brevispora TaxID=887462 RepID=A0A561UUB6_9ACTN|nr:CoA ester lyase [Streptomyces brevispora]TWG02965.1 citrate lyase subunit beta/citryl-CoA lyase [Streptomyces brevispora]WSC15942.1 CoA ester lyase [Streptomyces brevispora]
MNSALTRARTLLFVPADRPDRFTKAAESGAGAVILDLEDAVAPERKEEARRHAAAWLSSNGHALLRVNGPGTPWYEADVAMAARSGTPVVVPKAEDPAALSELGDRLGPSVVIVALVETALGVERAFDVCSSPGVVRAALGNVDLAGELGVSPDDHAALAYARSRLVCAAAAAGLAPPVDGVTTAVRDETALTADLAHARRLGFAGKLCIHPAQVAQSEKAFAPTEEELRWAREVTAAREGVSVVNGKMVDKPVLERARRMLASP